MNGVHDMGGDQGMGPVQYEKDEPVFHAPWEGRVYAINRALGVWRKWTIDGSRHGIELLPPADYFRMSYYERWLERTTEISIKTGLVTRAEVESGKAEPGNPKATPPLMAANAEAAARIRASARRPVQVVPRFAVGQQVRARNINPLGHTRLPRYARAKAGVIDRDHGVFVFPDTTAHSLGENPQHVYSVRFSARELWGDQAKPQDSVYLDMWDDYLEPA
jgi:nitrile hydratase subunit beta